MLRIVMLLCLIAGGPALAQSPPSELPRIFEKLTRGEPLTPEEQQALAGLGMTMGGLAGPPAGPVTLADLGVCPAPGTLAPSAAMDRASYVALARTLSEQAAARDPGAKAAIDDLLAEDPSSGEHVGVAALLEGGTSAAMYAMARAAVANPDDAMIASNLGVLLTGTGQFAGAEATLAYAAALEPDAPLVAVNRAWNAYGAGAAELARQRFQDTLGMAPNLPGARLGIGLLAACSGDTERAEEEIRAAVQGKRSKVGILALAAIAPTDPGPWRSEVPYDPPDPLIALDLVASARLVDQAVARQERLERIHGQWAAASVTRTTQTRAAFEADGNAYEDTEMYRDVHQAYVDAVDARLAAFGEELAALLIRWHADGPLGDLPAFLARMTACGSDETCAQTVQYEACRAYEALGTELHADASRSIRRHWAQTKPDLQELWAWSAGALEHFHSPAWQAILADDLQHEVAFHELQFAQHAALWDRIALSVLDMECTPPTPPTDRTAPSTAAPEVPRGGICDALQMTIAAGPLSFVIDCSKTTATVSGANNKLVFTSDVLTGEATLYWGVTGSKGKFSGEIGPYLNFNGRVTGAGLAAEGAVGMGGVGYKQGFRAGFAAIEGGPPYDYATVVDTWGGPTGW